MKPSLVILAAGESRRLGTCKALVDLCGRSPLERLLSAGSQLEGAPLVITGAHHEQIAAALGAAAEAAFNPLWQAGRSTGVALAARLRPGRDLCLAPVDIPLVPAAVFEALAEAWAQAGGPELGWLAPRVELDGRARHGHPVVVGRGLLQRLADLPAGVPLSELRQFSHPLLAVRVANAEILDDLDTEADLEALRTRLRTQVSTQFGR